MDLSIDTSTKRISITIGDESFFKTYIPKGIKQNLELIKIFKKMLKENNINLKDIKNYYFTIGPGSFTGIRFGISFVLGLTEGRKVNYFPISTLEAIALSQEGISTPVLTQSLKYFYAGIYNVKNSIKTILKPNIFKIEELKEIKKGIFLTTKEFSISFEGLVKIENPISEIIFKKRKILKKKNFPIKPLYIVNPYEI